MDIDGNWLTKDHPTTNYLRVAKGSNVNIKWGADYISGASCVVNNSGTTYKTIPGSSASSCVGEKFSSNFSETGDYRAQFTVSKSGCSTLTKNLHIKVTDNPFTIIPSPNPVNLITVGTSTNNQVKSDTAIVKVTVITTGFNKNVNIDVPGMFKSGGGNKLVCGTNIKCNFIPNKILQSNKYSTGTQIQIAPIDIEHPLEVGVYNVLITGKTGTASEDFGTSVRLNVRNVSPTYEER
jgi:hypothetical protein